MQYFARECEKMVDVVNGIKITKSILKIPDKSEHGNHLCIAKIYLSVFNLYLCYFLFEKNR